MITVTILIPLADNEATTFAPSHHTAFEIQLAAIFGGITRLPGEFVGAWFGGETLYADTNRAYQVAVPGLIERCGDLTRAIEIARVHYRQEAIYVSYLGQAEIIGPPKV
jgi:hypothetical protein